MSLSCRSASVFGPSAQYIKINGGDFVAIEGSNILERLITSDLRIPYRQILKSRIILKPGQINYLLNFLGLGDNATFLAIKAVYNGKSVLEEDNVIHWSFYDDLTKVYSFAQLMVLTGNSSNRVKQLYLTNPNPNYAISLDVMVGVIDDNYSFFSDTLNQVGTSFTGLSYTDIKSYVIGESIVINDKSLPVRPLIYINIVNIAVIEKSGNILILDDQSLGSIFLQFLTEYDTNQALSLLNYVIENPNIDIDSLSPISDTLDPVVYFYSKVGSTGDYIALNGSTASVPYNTSQGLTFSTSISFGTYSVIDKDLLIDLLISGVSDNRDGTMSIVSSNIILTGTSSVSTITATGSYVMTFDFSDIAQNYLDGVNISLNIMI
jgi:hypothetical protein